MTIERPINKLNHKDHMVYGQPQGFRDGPVRNVHEQPHRGIWIAQSALCKDIRRFLGIGKCAMSVDNHTGVYG